MDPARRSHRRFIFKAMALLAMLLPVALMASSYLQEKRNVALIVAIHRQDTRTALDVINAGANPNMVDSGPMTITLRSVWRRMLNRFHGRHSAPGPSALALAVQADLTSVARALLDKGATGANDLIRSDKADTVDPFPLLHVAVNQGDCDLAAQLILHGADVNKLDELGRTALCEAVSNEDTPMVTVLLAHHAAPNVSGENVIPPLVTALDDLTAPVIVKCLLDHGANPNGDGKQNVPLLNTDSAAFVAALIAHGADIRIRDPNGESPIEYAVYYNNWLGVKLLLDHGADVDDHDRSGETLLQHEADAGSADHVALLLRYGATVNWHGESGRALLMSATEAGSLATVRLLVAHGVTVTGHDRDGRTALHIAASSGNPELTRVLIKAGSEVNFSDMIGETALDEAEEAGNRAAAAVLRSAGAQSHRAAQRIPAIGHILGLRLGYAGEGELHLRLGDGTSYVGASPGYCNWRLGDTDIDADGTDNSSNGYIVSSLDISGWHGRLGTVPAFQHCGFGPWGDLRVGMTIAEARAALRSKLPPPTLKPGVLTWVAHTHGRRDGKSELFTYSATLKFGNGLQSLHLEISVPPDGGWHT